MKRFALITTGLISMACLHSLSAQDAIRVKGNISTNTNWNVDTVYVDSTVVIESGINLSIDPGTYIEFQGHHSIIVNGALHAIGAMNDTILFTIDDPSDFDLDLNDPAGSWNGIFFGSTPDTTRLSYCKFQYSKAVGSDWPHNSGGAINTSWGGGTSLIIRKCHFFHNYSSNVGGAITYEGTDFALLEDCRFTENKAGNQGGAIFCWSIKLVCTGTNFTGNSADGQGGVAAFGNDCNLEFNENIFRNNSSPRGGALSGYGTILRITNNIFANNHSTSEGGAIRSYENPYPVITGNIFVNNESGTVGGGLYLNLSDAILVNNTICNNAASSGAGIYLNKSHPEIHNSIIYGNLPDQLNIGSTFSSPDIFHTNLEGDSAAITGDDFTGEYLNNIDDQPEFVSPTAGAGNSYDGLAGDWALMDYSPCLNGGAPDDGSLNLPDTDVYLKPRISNKIIDMGASETYLGNITVSDPINEDTYWFSDTVKITADIIILDGATLRINRGTVVQFQGEYWITVFGRLLAEGTDKDTIVFTIIPGLREEGWKSIIFNNASGAMSDNDTSWIDHCRMEYGRSGHQGSIRTVNFSRLVISNSSFYHSSHEYGGGGIIKVDNSSPVIRDNFFSKCSGAAVITADLASPLITGNHIIDNEALGINGWMSNCTVIGNFISNNNTGIYARASNTKDWIITDNIVVNNTTGFRIYDGAGAIVQNNTFINNYKDLWASTTNLIMVNNIMGTNLSGIGDESNVKFFHNNLVGGKEELYIYPNSVVEFDQNIESDPVFMNPSENTGKGFDSDPGDWQILSISPCINAGTTEKTALPVSQNDFFGNPRMSNLEIDIGADENQMGTPVFIKQPLGAVKCSEDSLLLRARANDTVFYQWQKDGINITGATGPDLQLNSLDLGDRGSYQCIISNSFGAVSSYPANLIVIIRPEFIVEPQGGWATPGEVHSLETFARGSNLDYAWFRNDTIQHGRRSPNLVLPDPDFTDEGIYSCVISNSCGTDTTASVSLWLAPQICMVTVSPTTGNNLVVWEKKSMAPLMAYNVYRESVAAGIYDRLATISYDDLSVFVDTTADPTVQAYLYKITAIDTGEVETDIDLCNPHKTIHLIVSTNPELKTTQLQWDNYFGFEYQTYTIYKSSTGTNFDPVHSLSASLNSWTDPNPITGDQFYRIAVEKPDPCLPEGTGKKAGTGPYVHSLSNLDDNKLKEGQLPPDTITLNNNTIEEEMVAATVIGKLLTEDPDSIDAHIYQFVPGTGDDDNNSFTLLGDLLLSSETFDFETKNQYSVRIRSTDQAGNHVEVVFDIQIIDIDETTGMPEGFASRVKAYPNPFNHETRISLPDPEGIAYELILMDLAGKVFRIIDDASGPEYVLEKGDLEAGLYVLEIKGKNISRIRLILK